MTTVKSAGYDTVRQVLRKPFCRAEHLVQQHQFPVGGKFFFQRPMNRTERQRCQTRYALARNARCGNGIVFERQVYRIAAVCNGRKERDAYALAFHLKPLGNARKVPTAYAGSLPSHIHHGSGRTAGTSRQTP